MKFKFIYTFFALSVIAMAFMAHSGGRAASQGKGNTGAPGDEIANGVPRTCVTCHNNTTAFQVSLDIAIADASGNPVTTYNPGETYDMTVTINAVGGTPAGYGFQMLALNAPLDVNGDDVAGFSNPGSNVQIAIADNGRQYAEHDGVSAENEFTVQWTAPAAGSGPVTFYSCGNGNNDNNMSSGDAAACNTLEISENPVATNDLANDVQLKVFPNPVETTLNLDLDSNLSGDFQAILFDQQGRQVLAKRIVLQTGANQEQFAVSHLPGGIYNLQLSNGSRNTSVQVVKR